MVADVEAASPSSSDRVTQYHAAVGEGVRADHLAELERKLLEEARKECMQQKWEQALELFTHALAVSEKGKASVTSDPGGRGTLVHNIAFCLHCMGEFEDARRYYEQSLDCFKRVTFPLHQKLINGLLYPERLAFELIYGGLNHNRIQMTKERLLDLSFGRKPNLEQLDELGRRKVMPQPAAPPAGKASAEPSGGRATWGRDVEHRPGWLVAAAQEDAASEDAPHAPRPGAPSGGAADDRADEEEVGSSQREEARGAAAAALGDAGQTQRDVEEEEAARLEWLAYYMQVGDLEHAEELVVSAAEHNALESLRQRGAPRP